MRAATALLLLSALVALAIAACPNNCSGHGSCSGSTCSCNSGWAGDDCSESVTSISANRPLSGNVASRLWNFYSFASTSVGSTLTWSVNQTSAGDCDLYLRAGSVPTRYDYDQRDIGTGNSMLLVTSNTKSTTYYAGVYGYTGCSYTIGAFLPGGASNNCPNACSGHGTCSSQGVCTCQSGWTGSDCSTALFVLSPSRSQTSTVSAGAWIYYQWNITTTTSTATLIVNQTSATADCDLYVKAGSMPSRFDYDFSDKSSNQNFAVPIPQPAPGVWYAGVTGFTTCTYTITLQLNTQSCPPGACSAHGSCRANSATCVCSSGYSGSNCETALGPLAPGQTASGYSASSASWNYYHYAAFSADSLLATLTRTSSPGSCALYARQGTNPKANRFDYMVADSASSISMEVPDPGENMWYFGVVGFNDACNYTLSITDTEACPNSCSGNGQCYMGTCLCNSGWSGDDCSVSQVNLQPGMVVSGSVTNGQWAYFTLVTPARVSISSITVALHELNTVGTLWLFVSEQLTASLRQYDYSDTSESASHVVHFERDIVSTQSATVYSIGVYGSPFGTGSPSIPFTLTAWYPSI